MSALIELGFHDNALDAEWIVRNTAAIAKALYCGICDFYSYEYRASAECMPEGVSAAAPAIDHDIYLSVRVPQSRSEELIGWILAMGYACKVLNLA